MHILKRLEDEVAEAPSGQHSLESGVLSWSSASVELPDGTELVEGDAGTLQVSRSRSPARARWWHMLLGLEPGDTHWLHVELRQKTSRLRLRAQAPPESLEGLPWLEGRGETLELDVLLSVLTATRYHGAQVATWEKGVDEPDEGARSGWSAARRRRFPIAALVVLGLATLVVGLSLGVWLPWVVATLATLGISSLRYGLSTQRVHFDVSSQRLTWERTTFWAPYVQLQKGDLLIRAPAPGGEGVDLYLPRKPARLCVLPQAREEDVKALIELAKLEVKPVEEPLRWTWTPRLFWSLVCVATVVVAAHLSHVGAETGELARLEGMGSWHSELSGLLVSDYQLLDSNAGPHQVVTNGTQVAAVNELEQLFLWDMESESVLLDLSAVVDQGYEARIAMTDKHLFLHQNPRAPDALAWSLETLSPANAEPPPGFISVEREEKRKQATSPSGTRRAHLRVTGELGEVATFDLEVFGPEGRLAVLRLSIPVDNPYIQPSFLVAFPAEDQVVVVVNHPRAGLADAHPTSIHIYALTDSGLEEERVYTGHRDTITAIDCTPEICVTGSNDLTVRVWELP